MDHVQQLEVFKAQTSNVRRLDAARRQIRRSINHALRRSDDAAEEAHTIVLALLYCAWMEATLLKLLCTPYGLSPIEIEQIKSAQQTSGIGAAWVECIDVGLRRVGEQPKTGDLPNIRQRLCKLIETFVKSPAELRNKIAHGQWVTCLNRDRTAVNADLTGKLAKLDVVELERWFEAGRGLADIFEALIESPRRHFRGTYWKTLAELEERMSATKSWSRESRLDVLRRRPVRAPQTTAG